MIGLVRTLSDVRVNANQRRRLIVRIDINIYRMTNKWAVSWQWQGSGRLRPPWNLTTPYKVFYIQFWFYQTTQRSSLKMSCNCKGLFLSWRIEQLELHKGCEKARQREQSYQLLLLRLIIMMPRWYDLCYSVVRMPFFFLSQTSFFIHRSIVFIKMCCENITHTWSSSNWLSGT